MGPFTACSNPEYSQACVSPFASSGRLVLLTPATPVCASISYCTDGHADAVFFPAGVFLFEASSLEMHAQDAADAGRLAETIHRRGNASLSFFAATCLGLPLCSYLTLPIVTPQAGVAFGLLSAAQWLVAGRGYAKYSPEGADPFAILGVSLLCTSFECAQAGDQSLRSHATILSVQLRAGSSTN